MHHKKEQHKDKRLLVLIALGASIYFADIFSYFHSQDENNFELAISSAESKPFISNLHHSSPGKERDLLINISLSQRCGEVPPQFSMFFNLPMSLNKASAEDLTRLPGIGPQTAAKIVKLRTSLGYIGSMDTLTQVKGIGPKMALKLKPFLCFD